MTQKIGTSSWLSKAANAAGKGLTAVGLLFGAGALTAGCLDRPVAPATPTTTNVYINQIRQTGVDKIDLVFMIDNSISMSDKQQILAKAVPVLVQRLITPTCVDMNGAPVGNGTVIADAQSGMCAQGIPEFRAIKDIHIALVTSSLGDHGSNDVCSDAQNAENAANNNPPSFYNDLAQLLPSVRPAANLYSWNNSGFLVWDPRDPTKVPGTHKPQTTNETDPDTFKNNFTAMVTAAGEHGCGFEASLEAWYRFLIDPEPVAKMSQTGDSPPNALTPHSVDVRGPDPTDVGDHPDKGFVHKNNVANMTVLAQRAAFLRPDSLVAIVMLTDENDCSIQDEDGTQGWIVGWKGGVGKNNFSMPRANSVCAQDPNNKCCRPCSAGPVADCMDNMQDAACAMGASLTKPEDSTNERCFAQKQRFGVDLLYPTSRYSDGLKNLTIRPRFGGPEVPNPLYASVNGQPPRDAGLVFLAGIVGVPWQDVSTTDSWQGSRLTYMTAQELIDNNRWPVILGDPNASPVQLPSDPFMIESIDPRTMGATNPLINEPILPSSSTMLNKINGHEQDVPGRDDLQFACIFNLTKAVDAAACDANADGCDCNADEFDKHSPLCQGVTMTATGSQVRAKGYPGLRELEVLREFGNNSIVASICPKNIAPANGRTEATDPDYGYNPAVAAIVQRLKEALTVKCLPRPLAPDTTGSSDPNAGDYNPDNGKVPCAVVEVRPAPQDSNGSYTTCQECNPQLGRTPLTGERAKVVGAAKEYLRQNGICGGASEIACEDECFCELNQFTGTELRACQTGGTTNTPGYCYVDPAAVDPGDTELLDGENNLVKGCQPTARRILNFVGDNIPAKDGLAFIACIGATPEN